MRIAIIACLFVFAAQDLFATPKGDSIVAFTGAHSKFVWKRIAWCDESYKPKASWDAAMASGVSIVLFDTKEGVERTLDVDKTSPNIQNIRISRSGKWAIWNDWNSSKSYVIDLTAASSVKRIFLDKATCSYWSVNGFWVDQATGIENIFGCDNFSPTSYHGNAIYKIPLKADGSADAGKATKIWSGSANSVEATFSLSEDGKKLGGAFPWPTTKILDLATGRLDTRHEGQFGCQANLAPENSYRFFHCLDEHEGVRMYDGNLSTTNWTINFRTTAPNLKCAITDFSCPRWTNNIRFLSNTYPMTSYLDGDPNCWGGVNIWGQDANGVKTNVRQDLLSNFFLAEWSADYKSITKTLMIASDIRYFQYGGDAWLANGVVTGVTGVGDRGIRRMIDDPTMRFTVSGGRVEAKFNSESGTITLLTPAGNVVGRASGAGKVAVALGNEPAGTYVIRLSTPSGVSSTRVLLAR